MWIGSLVGFAYGIWAWGTILIVGFDAQQEFGAVFSRGFMMMPLYLPSFIGIYILNQNFPKEDVWFGGLLGVYGLVTGTLLIVGERAHGAAPLDGTLAGLALPICTLLTLLLAWRVHLSWTTRRSRIA